MDRRLLFILVFLMMVGSVSAALSDGVKYGYTFDTGDYDATYVYDVTGIYNGTNYGVQTGVTGKIGQAILYDATPNERIDVSAGDWIGTNPFSVSMWVYRTDTQAFSVTLISQDTTGNNRWFIGIEGDSTTRIFVKDTSGANALTTETVDVGRWVHLVYIRDGTDCYVYIDGALKATENSCDAGDISTAMDTTIGDVAAFGAYDGKIDELYVFDIALEIADILILNATITAQYPFTLPTDFSVTGVDEDSLLPVNGLNITLDNSSGDLAFGNVTGNIVYSNVTEGIYNITITPVSQYYEQQNFTNYNVSNSLTVNLTFTDPTYPVVTFNHPLSDNSTRSFFNFPVNISVRDDNNYEAIINITDPWGNQSFYQVFNTTGTTFYNITNSTNNTIKGNYTIRIEAADGHTLEEISSISHSLDHGRIDFRNGEVIVYPSVENDFDGTSTIKRTDRYGLFYERNGLSARENDYDEFFVESKGKIEIMDGTGYKGHLIIKTGSSMSDWYWMDFETRQDYDVTVRRINNNKVSVRVYGNSREDYLFESLGKLNVENETITYFFDGTVPNLTESFETAVISGTETTFYLNVTGFNEVLYNPLLGINAILMYNYTNYTATLFSLTSDLAEFRQMVTVLEVLNSPFNISHQWFVNISNITGDYENNLSITNLTNQTTFDITISECLGGDPYPILNFSYFDQVVQTNAITVTNAYDLTFDDGTNLFHLTGGFDSNSSDDFCTSLDPTLIPYNWNFYGTLILSKEDYTTKIVDYPIGSPTLVSNIPPTNLSLYMITIDNSTTVTYTWWTTSNALIDGTLLVYECADDGGKILVDSIPILSGTAIANIELLTQAYSYEVIIDGVTYSDSGFSTCHVEVSDTVNYYVDIVETPIAPVIGLYFIDCVLTNTSTDQVTMVWEANVESTESIRGCIVGYTTSVSGQTEVFEECTNSSSYSLVSFIDPALNVEYVRGRLTQGSVTGYCTDTVVLSVNKPAAVAFGGTALFVTALLVLAIALIFVESGELMLIMGAVAFIAMWILGVLNFGWVITSSVVAIMVLVAWVGRNARKRN